MVVLVDLLVLIVLVLAIYAEAGRGLFLALSDVVRVAAALILGLAAYTLVQLVGHNYPASLVAFVLVALVVILLVPTAIRSAALDPAWAKTVLARIGAGLVGAGLGLAICAAFVPVLSRTPEIGLAIARSRLGSRFLDAAPWVYYAADQLNLDLPMLNLSPVRFEDEGTPARPRLVQRVNYSRLDGSTCIACGGRVRFAGYQRRFGFSVSPLFVCEECERTSDGCQTFEGFHLMYGRCPRRVAGKQGAIDCGVWPNGIGVVPRGPCLVCGE